MNSNKVTIMSEEFENGQTGEIVQGITIIVDGKLKQVMDVLIGRNGNYNYNNYTELVQAALFEGIDSIIKKSR